MHRFLLITVLAGTLVGNQPAWAATEKDTSSAAASSDQAAAISAAAEIAKNPELVSQFRRMSQNKTLEVIRRIDPATLRAMIRLMEARRRKEKESEAAPPS